MADNNQNPVKREFNPNSPIHYPVLFYSVAIVLGGLIAMYNMPDTPLPTNALLKNIK
jgi:hypothetical protein